jgi:hypothetical protein
VASETAVPQKQFLTCGCQLNWLAVSSIDGDWLGRWRIAGPEIGRNRHDHDGLLGNGWAPIRIEVDLREQYRVHLRRIRCGGPKDSQIGNQGGHIFGGSINCGHSSCSHPRIRIAQQSFQLVLT